MFKELITAFAHCVIQLLIIATTAVSHSYVLQTSTLGLELFMRLLYNYIKRLSRKLQFVFQMIHLPVKRWLKMYYVNVNVTMY